jgi:hypothetical protein
MKAHQRIIREEKAKTESTPKVDLSSSNAIVKEISYAEAKKVILEYEWLKCMPAIVKHCYGLYFGEHCAGVVVYGAEYSENLGHWDKFGYSGKMLLLARGACVHWSPDYAGSYLIRQSMKLLPVQYEIITCTVDELAGEIGTIYQACGFSYVGSMRDSNPNIKNKGGNRFGVLIDGKLYGSRAIRAKIGSQKKEEILKIWPDAKFVKQKSKCRYFAFRGSKKAQKNHLKAIHGLIKPYPKRNA